MLMETKFARLFASDDIFTVKSVLFKTMKKCFFNSEELRKLPLKTAFAQKQLLVSNLKQFTWKKLK